MVSGLLWLMIVWVCAAMLLVVLGGHRLLLGRLAQVARVDQPLLHYLLHIRLLLRLLLVHGILGGCGSFVELLARLSASHCGGALRSHGERFVSHALVPLRLPHAHMVGPFLLPAFLEIGLTRSRLDDELAARLAPIVVSLGALQGCCAEGWASLALVGALLPIDGPERDSQLAAWVHVLWLSLVLHLARRSRLLVQRLVVPAEATWTRGAATLYQVRKEHLIEVGRRSCLRRRHVVMMLAACCCLRALRRSWVIEVQLIVVVRQGRVHSVAHDVILGDMLELVLRSRCRGCLDGRRVLVCIVDTGTLAMLLEQDELL